MLIHLVEVFTRQNQVIIEETFNDFIYNDGIYKWPAANGLNFKVTLKHIAKDEIMIEGISSTTLIIPCDRCTKEVRMDINTEFSRNIYLHNDEEDSAYIDGANLNLRELINQEMIDKYPRKVLCSDECKGLCPTCGVNLNNKNCTCDRGQIDIRMAQFKDLLESEFKEV